MRKVLSVVAVVGVVGLAACEEKPKTATPPKVDPAKAPAPTGTAPVPTGTAPTPAPTGEHK